jgi:hypothetical protein
MVSAYERSQQVIIIKDDVVNKSEHVVIPIVDKASHKVELIPVLFNNLDIFHFQEKYWHNSPSLLSTTLFPVKNPRQFFILTICKKLNVARISGISIRSKLLYNKEKEKTKQ